MNIVFMGTPEFAVSPLEELNEKYNILAVVTQTDKPKGRNNKLSITPVKEFAVKNNIEVLQPQKIRKDAEIIEKIKNMNPDFIIVVAYGQILSKEILDIPKYGCINLHASLLPKYRGAAPINWAVIKGEKVSGNTTMFMDEGLDTGDMLLKNEFEIGEYTTAGDLYENLKNSGGKLLIETIEKIISGNIERIKQPLDGGFYAKMLDKKIAVIDFNDTSENIHNLVRGLNPYPVARTIYEGKLMKVFKTKIIKEKVKEAKNGEILNSSEEGIMVKTKDGAILITDIQFESSKAMTVSNYLKGNEIVEGKILGGNNEF